MYTDFINKSIQKLCEDFKFATKKLGERNAKLLFQRVNEIRSAPSLEDLKKLPGPRCHPLKGNRRGQHAVDLVHPSRLVFLPLRPATDATDKDVTDATIIEVTDYH